MRARPYTGTPIVTEDIVAEDIVAEDQPRVRPDDRRASSRITNYHAEHLRVEPELFARLSKAAAPSHAGIGATLADLSETGIGLHVLAPLSPNTEVVVCVDLYRDASGDELKARAEVMHCRAADDGSYRVGLAFRSVDCRPLDSDYYPDLDS